MGDTMNWLIRGLQRKRDNQPSLSSLTGLGEDGNNGGRNGTSMAGTYRIFMELWSMIMAVNKLYWSVKYKVNVRDYSQTLSLKETLWKMKF